MNVFTDFHHAGLLNSLIMLFEGRLGGNVYRPIGTDWYYKGFWKVYDHPATVEQFLGIGGNTPDGTPPLNDVVAKDQLEPPRRGKYLCQDIDSGQTNKAITFDAFMSMPFDFVIASLPEHIERFKQLCELHPSKPKLIFQIGNAWSVEASQCPNVMASALVPNVPADINFVSYHQEFDLSIFYVGAPTSLDVNGIFINRPIPENKIYSFVNIFQTFPDWGLFQMIESSMPDWDFKSFGGQCRDGAAHGARQVAQFMRESRFIWHTKYGGDGYGHIIYNSAAVGRPLIVKREYYNGKMGQELMEDGKTCIAIDGLGVAEIVEKIEFYSQPERYSELCRNTYENFIKCVNFDSEADRIKTFLDNCK